MSAIFSMLLAFFKYGCGEVGDEVIVSGRFLTLKVALEPTPTPTSIPHPVVMAIWDSVPTVFPTAEPTATVILVD